MTKFYGIGIGPGDPELLTLKAVNALKQSDFIFEATSHTNTISIAGSIAKKYVKEKSTFIPLIFPMLKNKKIMKKAWKKNAEIVAEKIFLGHTCSFVTIGDPMLYSTCSYLISELKKVIAPEQIEIIPGISTIQIFSAKTLIPLAEGEEAISIYPAFSRKLITKIKNSQCKNIVIMKAYKNKNVIANFAKKYNYELIYASKLCLKNEKISFNIQEIKNMPTEYLSTFILKK